MLTNWSSKEPNNEHPKKFDPFDVVFCAHCDKLHHVDSQSYLQVVGDIYRGLSIDLMDEIAECDEVDELGDIGTRSYISYILEAEMGNLRLVSVFCSGNKDEVGCLEKYMQQCRTTDE